MRWTGNDRIISFGKSIIFSGEPEHTNGVGFVLSQRANNALVYPPTEDSKGAKKEEFYECLQQTIDEAPRRDLKIVMGDFNAKLGGDQAGLEKVVGPLTYNSLGIGIFPTPSDTQSYVVVAEWRNGKRDSLRLYQQQLQSRFHLLEEFDYCTEAEEQWNIIKEATRAWLKKTSGEGEALVKNSG
ncbi:unnamed protein product [Heligmosomoides polygyrus]|uniref:Endo/exonuclease/phosphatase domain-containing protein n=1 Tax=Heligmosomoides polygyrus TaxID=6339 RepID=A0A183GB02_HELPZ|nr:unnamed protein product [Heligmosomoides polygyrus]